MRMIWRSGFKLQSGDEVFGYSEVDPSSGTTQVIGGYTTTIEQFAAIPIDEYQTLISEKARIIGQMELALEFCKCGNLDHLELSGFEALIQICKGEV